MDFFREFWHYYIMVLVVVSLVFLVILLYTQSRTKVIKGTQINTMGHEWDGIEEYNTPLPRWWMYSFYLSIIFAIGYLVLYPGFGNWPGLKQWTSTGQYQQEIADLNATVNPLFDQYLKESVPTLANNPEAVKLGRSLFQAYCIQCHASDAKGSKGYPNLSDAIWLHGGSPDKIVETISAGRKGIMPPKGGAQLDEESIKDTANYVMKLAGYQEGVSATHYDPVRADRGEQVFSKTCVACHGTDGKGNVAIGAPNLTLVGTPAALYARNKRMVKASVIETITNGRNNTMPAWQEALGNGKIHLLATYVYSLSNH